MTADERSHTMEDAFHALDRERDTGQISDGAGRHALLIVEPEDDAVAAADLIAACGFEKVVYLFEQEVALDPLGILKSACVVVGQRLLFEAASTLGCVALAKVIVGGSSTYHFDEGDKGISVARHEFAQHPAIVFAELEEDILNDVVDDGSRGLSPQTSNTERAERDGPGKATDKLPPFLAAGLIG